MFDLGDEKKNLLSSSKRKEEESEEEGKKREDVGKGAGGGLSMCKKHKLLSLSTKGTLATRRSVQ